MGKLELNSRIRLVIERERFNSDLTVPYAAVAIARTHSQLPPLQYTHTGAESHPVHALNTQLSVGTGPVTVDQYAGATFAQSCNEP